MKKNPGRKERRNIAKKNRRAEGRVNQKLNERAQMMGYKSYKEMERE